MSAYLVNLKAFVGCGFLGWLLGGLLTHAADLPYAGTDAEWMAAIAGLAIYPALKG